MESLENMSTSRLAISEQLSRLTRLIKYATLFKLEVLKRLRNVEKNN